MVFFLNSNPELGSANCYRLHEVHENRTINTWRHMKEKCVDFKCWMISKPSSINQLLKDSFNLERKDIRRNFAYLKIKLLSSSWRNKFHFVIASFIFCITQRFVEICFHQPQASRIFESLCWSYINVEFDRKLEHVSKNHNNGCLKMF